MNGKGIIETINPDDYFRAKCTENGLKITPQRMAIYNELKHSREHPDAETIYKAIRQKLPNISFDTVYRTLMTFSKIGLINMVEGYGQARRFDPDLHSHHHLWCRQCGKIVDIVDKTYDNLPLPQDVAEDFVILNKRVVLEGICPACRAKE